MNPNTIVKNTAIAIFAALLMTSGTTFSALAYETGYGPIQLIRAQNIDDPAGPCKTADIDAGVAIAQGPHYPQIALEQGLEGFATVTFSMAFDGGTSNVKLAGTSGNSSLDQAAVDAVKSSRFAPEVHNCGKIAGLYGVSVVFSQSNAPDWPNLVVGSSSGTGGGHIVSK